MTKYTKISAVGFIVVTVAGIAGWFHYKYTQAQKEIAKLSAEIDKQELAQKETYAALAEIQKNMTPLQEVQSAPQPDQAVLGADATIGETTVKKQARLITVEVRNGTKTVGLGKTWAARLEDGETYKVVKTTDAKKKDYTETLVVNFAKSEGAGVANNLANLLKATPTIELPEGENASTADILVIVGQDKVEPN